MGNRSGRHFGSLTLLHGGLGLYWSHLGYIGAIWAKMDRCRSISDKRFTQIVIYDDLYAHKSPKSVKVGLQPELGVGVCCK